MIPLSVLLFIMITACGQNQGEKSQNALIQKTNPDPIHIKKGETNHVASIKHEISSFPEVYDVAVVKGKKDTLVAYKVKHLHRFKMDDIEKKMTAKLKRKYPKENFTVSSDYKIFLEAVKLQEEMDKPGFSDRDAEKRLQKIITLKDETT
jgi:predicted RND superfamily exporter protein